MTQKLYAGDTLARQYQFKNEDKQLFNPDTVVIDIIDPNGDGIVERSLDPEDPDTLLDIDDLDPVEMGIFNLYYNLPVDAVAGSWIIRVTATITIGERQNTEDFPFTVESK